MSIKIISLVLFALFTGQCSGMNISMDDFEKLNVNFLNSKSGMGSMPLVLIYDRDNRLVRSLVGNEIIKLDNYQKIRLIESEREVATNSILSFLSSIGLRRKKQPYVLIFLGMNFCKPCYTRLEEFNSLVKPNLANKFQIISLDVMVK